MPRLTETEADELLARTEAAYDDDDMMETLIMPNGKPIGVCTKEYMEELARDLQEIVERKRKRAMQLCIEIEKARYAMSKKPGVQ